MFLLPLALVLSCEPAPPSSAPVQRESVTIEAWTDGPEGPKVSIVGDLTRREDGKMWVTMRYSDLEDDMWSFRATGVSPELVYDEVRFSTVDGDTIGHQRKGRSFDLEGRPQREVVVEYAVQPGGDGRHGHQGIVQQDFALFDGRVFLVPDGAGAMRGARVRYLAPEDWTTGHALREQDGWIYFDNYGPTRVHTSLGTACFGVGPFEGTTKPLGSSEMRVYNHASIAEKEKKELTESSLAIFQWFHDDLGFDPGFPLAVVWSPEHEGGKIYGGSSANGTCFQQPRANLRAWQLMAHRLGHSLNKYAPSGMTLRDEEDAWFKEGWPSYIEMIATEGAGVTPKSNRWNDLYRTYHRTRKDTPEQDIAMKDEPDAKAAWTEYLHYFKAPLVVMLLDEWVQRHHPGKNLTEFMRLAYAEHGAYRSPFDLRAELEDYVGAPLDDFWALHVDQRGWVYPVWKEAITPAVQRDALVTEGAATVGGRVVSGDYLHHLASTGDFAYYADIVTFLEQEEPRRAQLAAAGVQLLPPDFEQYRTGFEPAARYSLARAEQAYPLGKPVPRPTEQDRVAWTAGDADAEAFQKLLADEVRYLEQVLPAGVEQVVLQRKNPAYDKADEDNDEQYFNEAALVFGTKDEVRLQTTWAWTTGRVDVRAHREDQETDQRVRTISPIWTRSWTLYSKSKLPDGPGVVTFELKTESGQPITRSFWRRDP